MNYSHNFMAPKKVGLPCSKYNTVKPRAILKQKYSIKNIKIPLREL